MHSSGACQLRTWWSRTTSELLVHLRVCSLTCFSVSLLLVVPDLWYTIAEMSLARYSPLPQKEQGEKVDAESISTELPYRTRIKSSYWPYSVLLCLSVFLNIIQFTGSHAYTSSTFTKTPTEQGGRALNNWGSEPSEISKSHLIFILCTTLAIGDQC